MMFGLYFQIKQHFPNEFSLCSSHETSTPMKFWSRRAINAVYGFGGKGWFIGFIRHDTEKKIINESNVEQPGDGK